jgi:hypothetical protein
MCKTWGTIRIRIWIGIKMESRIPMQIHITIQYIKECGLRMCLMPGMVRLVSAMLVASTSLRCPSPVGRSADCWCSLGIQNRN